MRFSAAISKLILLRDCRNAAISSKLNHKFHASLVRRRQLNFVAAIASTWERGRLVRIAETARPFRRCRAAEQHVFALRAQVRTGRPRSQRHIGPGILLMIQSLSWE